MGKRITMCRVAGVNVTRNEYGRFEVPGAPAPFDSLDAAIRYVRGPAWPALLHAKDRRMSHAFSTLPPMVALPCLCTHCGKRFLDDDVLGSSGEVRDIRMTGCTTNCPACGGRADILDMDFDLSDDVLTVISAPERTLNELEHLREVLGDLVRLPEEERTLEAVVAAAPWLASVIDGLNFTNVSTTIMILLMILGLIMDVHRRPVAVNSPAVTVQLDLPREELNETIRQEIRRTFERGGATATPPEPGRNAPCHCGSGKKYKLCHGAPTRSDRS